MKWKAGLFGSLLHLSVEHMPREQKVGFTILIMIIGFAGAFCFRRQPDGEVALPPLQDENELNQLIAEYRLRPFLPGIDTKESIESHQELEEYLAMSLRPPGNAPLQDKAVPQPIIPSVETPDRKGPAKSRVEPQKNGRIRTVRANFQKKPSRGQSRTHIVQPGDTLSGIAQKYLGSASRYMEIYEANRDVLSGPDQLKLNMKLVIPTDGAESDGAESDGAESGSEPVIEARKSGSPEVSVRQKAKKTNQNKPEAASLANSASSKRPTRKKMFVPMKYSPFSRTASDQQEKRR